jgi:calcineurin-like phosphoesterase family protein
MPNIWFTADFHLGHKNIIRYCNRPFDTAEEMNRTIIERLNNRQNERHLVLSRGFLHRPAVELRREIGCEKIYAVPGNHGNHSFHGCLSPKLRHAYSRNMFATFTKTGLIWDCRRKHREEEFARPLAVVPAVWAEVFPGNSTSMN